MTTPLIEAVEQISTSFSEYTKNRFEPLERKVSELVERAEKAEALAALPRKTGQPGGGFRVHQTANGPAYEAKSTQRLAEIPGLQQKQPEISLDRWLAATVAGERCGDREAVQFVREQKQILTTSTGVLIPAEYQSEWIDLIRAQSVLNKAGMRTTTMTAKTQVHSAVTADPTASWHSENGSISAANPTFEARTLTANTIVTRCQASLEVTQDSPEFGTQLAGVMTRAMAAEIDRVGLEGNGTPPQPRGIKNTSGRTSQTSTGALTDYEEITSGLGALLGANLDLEQISQFAIMNPRTWIAYQNLVTGISSDKTPLARPRSIENMRFLTTSNIAGDNSTSPQVMSTLYLGDFRDLLFGVRMESSIETLKVDTYAGNLLLEFVGVARCDFLVTRPASFHTVEGISA